MVLHMPSKPRILVVGSGFAGISAYTTLVKKSAGNASITLISESLFFAHIPLIHEVAAGTIQPELVYWPVTDYVKCPKEGFMHARVLSVDGDAKTVLVLRIDGEEEAIPYDYLVLAGGSKANTFGTRGAREYAMPFRTLHHAEHIRNRILDACVKAESTKDGARRKELLSFILIGGGATGIELAGELAQMITVDLACQYPTLRHLMSLTIIERADGLLKERDPWFGKHVEKVFRASGLISILYGRNVTEVKENGVQTDKEFVPGRNIIWTGGAKATDIPVTSKEAFPKEERMGRVKVTPFLSTEAYPEIFVAGDQAFVLREDGTAYGMRAQFAVRQGRTAGENIIRALHGEEQHPFVWKERGYILTIGKGQAIAEIGGFRFTGLFAWIICHAVYIQSIVGPLMRLKSTWYWTKHFLKKRNVCRLG